MVQLKFDYEKCIRCKKCVSACFVDVIRWDEEENRPVAKYPQECAVCTWCMIECPKDVIDGMLHKLDPVGRLTSDDVKRIAEGLVNMLNEV